MIDSLETGPRSVPASEAPPGPVELYKRYHIDTAPAENLTQLPHKFLVQVKRFGLAKLLLKEIFHYFGKWDVVLNRPCIYGVFSGPVGGFSPRPQHCVGCLRCTIQHPDVVTILHNPARQAWGDAFFRPGQVETVLDEAANGQVPVRGQGFRGAFGGKGWDGMWTDMSEIVRPTRDGIHGREFISTQVDLGAKASRIELDRDGRVVGPAQRVFSVQVPMLLDVPPASVLDARLARVWVRSAQELDSLALLPLDRVIKDGLAGPAVAPLVPHDRVEDAADLSPDTRMVELLGWHSEAYATLTASLPESLVAVRLPFADGWKDDLFAAYEAGARIFHLEADYHGRGADGRFQLELATEAHQALVHAGIRDQVTLIGSGGIVAADHVPKAIIAGYDAICLDTPLLIALQCQPTGPFQTRASARFQAPANLPEDWAVQRIKNLSASWRDQLLEILGAMGIREVRRLRGELGRAMFQQDLEQDAFGDIEGFR